MATAKTPDHKIRYGQTHLLRCGDCSCSKCKQRKPSKEGRYIPLPGGLRQRWVCYTCEPEQPK